MTEIGFILGAAALFCLLTFGAAWVAAWWMNTGPGWWRDRIGRQRRSRRD